VEPFERRESLDTVLLGDFLLFSSINLGNKEWWVILSEGCGGCDVFWCKFFAMSTPWGIEFNK